MITRRGLIRAAGLAAPALILPRRALAQLGPGPLMVPGGGSLIVNVSGAQTQAFAFFPLNTSSTTMSFGAADPSRIIVVPIVAVVGNISAVTIGGVSATRNVRSISSSTFGVDLWSAQVPTGTSGTVSWTFSGNVTAALGAYAILHAQSFTPAATNSGVNATPMALPVTLTAGSSFVVGVLSWFGAAASSWSGLSQDNGANTGSSSGSVASARKLAPANPLSISAVPPTSSSAASAVAAWS